MEGIEKLVEMDDGRGGKIFVPSHLIMEDDNLCLGPRIIIEFRNTTISTGHYVSPNGYLHPSFEAWRDYCSD